MNTCECIGRDVWGGGWGSFGNEEEINRIVVRRVKLCIYTHTYIHKYIHTCIYIKQRGI